MTYEEACMKAKENSDTYECIKYVNAQVTLIDDIPTIVDFHVSDWFHQGSTVLQYHCGKRTEL